MEKIIDGKAIAAKLREEIAAGVAALKEQSVTPGLAVVLVGNDPASEVYVRHKKRATVEADMNSFEQRLPESASESELLASHRSAERRSRRARRARAAAPAPPDPRRRSHSRQ